MKHNKEIATIEIHLSNKDGSSRRRVLHYVQELQLLEEMLGASMPTKFIIAFTAMQAALRASLQLPDDQKFAIWTANVIRWSKLREGACAALAKADAVTVPTDNTFLASPTPEDVSLLEMYWRGKYGAHALLNAQDHILRILERMDGEAIAAFLAEFDERWHALQDVASEAESPEE